jgi:RimJ/RimL family protein N-acetyltransferase
MTTDRYWPLFDLRLVVDDLVLRPMTEADLPALADLLPDDLEQDPAATTYELPDRRRLRGVVVHQGYWHALGTWSVQHWRLNFVVLRGGELVGNQELEGTDFPLLRTVDTSSMLVPAVRGLGVGKAMRSAVLSLAFGPMEARSAITSAWHDNHASLGVSRALGYRPNGEELHARDDGADVMVHLRMTREDWQATSRPEVAITGWGACRPFFGI